MMRTITVLILLLQLVIGDKKERLVIIESISIGPPNKKMETTRINVETIKKIKEPLQALAALYSSFAGSNCDGHNCDLTTALGLGAQGSDAHKNLLRKWFPSDSTVNKIIRQNCFQPSNGSSRFNEYSSLIFETSGEMVFVRYTIEGYDHGKSTTRSG